MFYKIQQNKRKTLNNSNNKNYNNEWINKDGSIIHYIFVFI